MRDKNGGYYDIEIDVEKALVDGGIVNGLFYLKDLKQRKLFLTEDVDQMSIGEIVKNILQYNREDYGIPEEERKPIFLYIASNGGELDSGFELIDAIMISKTPVYTINLGYQYSMGFLIGLAGHRRYAMKNAKFLLHDGSNFVYNSGAKVQDQIEFNRKVDERVKQYILTHSQLTAEEYDSKFRVEWYMFSDEAREKGFIDYIIGEDCSIDEII